MAFYPYIVLDGCRYKTLAKQWRPSIARPATPRLTLQGSLEGTFGVGALIRWQGQIIAPHGDALPVPPDVEGNIVSLRASLAKTQALPFTDHNGTEYIVIAQGPFEEMSLVNVWNAASNKYYVSVQLTAKEPTT